MGTISTTQFSALPYSTNNDWSTLPLLAEALCCLIAIATAESATAARAPPISNLKDEPINEVFCSRPDTSASYNTCVFVSEHLFSKHAKAAAIVGSDFCSL